LIKGPACQVKSNFFITAFYKESAVQEMKPGNLQLLVMSHYWKNHKMRRDCGIAESGN
jgi:hypothetical protein